MIRPAVIVLAGLAAAQPAFAQNPPQPTLVLTISMGLTTGGDLWSVPRQQVPRGTGMDTLSLGRRLRPGLSGVFSATYHRSGALGYTVEVGYFGVASESRCAPHGTLGTDNQSACAALQGTHYPTSAVGFQAGLVYQVFPGRTASPYLRATAGFAALGESYVNMVPRIVSVGCASVCDYVLLREKHRTGAAGLATLALGTTVTAGWGYRIRLEVRDLIIGLPIAADSAPSTGADALIAPPGRATRHVVTLTAGLDVMLERTHRRRY